MLAVIGWLAALAAASWLWMHLDAERASGGGAATIPLGREEGGPRRGRRDD
jgi:hypothetical protein